MRGRRAASARAKAYDPECGGRRAATRMAKKVRTPGPPAPGRGGDPASTCGPAGIDAGDPAQRVVEAAAQLPGDGGVTGWAGLSWLGGAWFGGVVRGGVLLPVPLAVSSGNRMRPHPGVEVSQEVIAPRYLLRSGGVRTTEPLWSVAYEMRHARDDESAVVAFDMAAFNDLVSIAELAAFVETDLVARWGCRARQARAAAPRRELVVPDGACAEVGVAG